VGVTTTSETTVSTIVWGVWGTAVSLIIWAVGGTREAAGAWVVGVAQALNITLAKINKTKSLVRMANISFFLFWIGIEKYL
jgi:hypothetical protein